MSTVTGVRLCDSDCRSWGMFGLFRQVYLFAFRMTSAAVIDSLFVVKNAAPLTVFGFFSDGMVWIPVISVSKANPSTVFLFVLMVWCGYLNFYFFFSLFYLVYSSSFRIFGCIFSRTFYW